MIYARGHQRLSAEQLNDLRHRGDDSFCSRVSAAFGPLPCPPGYIPDTSTATALACEYVAPHVDDWTGKWEEGDGDDGPAGRRAVFWLAECDSADTVTLVADGAELVMQPGDWALFDDAREHELRVLRPWLGCAYQVRPASRNC